MVSVAGRMRGIAMAAGVLAVGGLGLALTPITGAHADGWCWGDPAITVSGQTFTVQVGIQAPVATAQADIQMANIVVHLPQGVTTYSCLLYTSDAADE